MRRCKGCSHPTICKTHGCAAVEARRNDANPYFAWQRGRLMAELIRRDRATEEAIKHYGDLAVLWAGSARKLAHDDPERVGQLAMSAHWRNVAAELVQRLRVNRRGHRNGER